MPDGSPLHHIVALGRTFSTIYIRVRFRWFSMSLLNVTTYLSWFHQRTLIFIRRRRYIVCLSTRMLVLPERHIDRFLRPGGRDFYRNQYCTLAATARLPASVCSARVARTITLFIRSSAPRVAAAAESGEQINSRRRIMRKSRLLSSRARAASRPLAAAVSRCPG